MATRILIVLGTRPELIKLAPLILALKASRLHDQFAVVSTSQHSELLEEQLKEWNIRPDYLLPPCPSGNNLTRLLAHTLSGLQDIVDELRTVEYMLVQGDTNTALCAANLAFLDKIKLLHIEAGLRTGDMGNPFPEEFNRIVASKAAYFHFAPTPEAADNLLREGTDPARILVTGNTGIDAIRSMQEQPPMQENAARDQVIITLHRRENIGHNYRGLAETLDALATMHPQLQFTWITHPNSAARIETVLPQRTNVKILPHLPYPDFIRLYEKARFIITDSGGVTEEAVQLGIPIVVFRKASERMEAQPGGHPMLISLDRESILDFFRTHLHTPVTPRYSYGDGTASQRIVRWLEKETEQQIAHTLIIGGGPAGSGILMKAMKDGTLEDLAEKGLVLMEQSGNLVTGNITGYKIASDTLSDVFLEWMEGQTQRYISTETLHAETRRIQAYRGRPMALPELDAFYTGTGKLIVKKLENFRRCQVMLNTGAERIVVRKDGLFEVHPATDVPAVLARNIVVATGGRPVTEISCGFDNTISLEPYRGRIVHADALLREKDPLHMLNSAAAPRNIVILGGSHSAFSVAHHLLSGDAGNTLPHGAISIWCRKRPPVFFPSAAEALHSGYTDFAAGDICPLTGRVYRLAGLRMDGRELYMRIAGLKKEAPEHRVTVNILEGRAGELQTALENAGAIILAWGYRFNMPMVCNEEGRRLRFKGEENGHWVDEHCRVLDADSQAVPGMYAMGLASGFIPSGDLGGEPSFRGQTNGIWYYQNAIAGLILHQLIHT